MSILKGLPQPAAEFFEGLTEPHQSHSLRLLNWCYESADANGCSPKVIDGYTGMPKGYDGIPQLIFAEFHQSGRAVANSRLFSIPLRCDEKHPLTIIFPIWRDNGHEAVDRAENGFRPIKLDEFLSAPMSFSNLTGGTNDKR